jgi:hypothetical protein
LGCVEYTKKGIAGQGKLTADRVNKENYLKNLGINTNALNLITSRAIAPHPIPLPSGERGG